MLFVKHCHVKLSDIRVILTPCPLHTLVLDLRGFCSGYGGFSTTAYAILGLAMD